MGDLRGQEHLVIVPSRTAKIRVRVEKLYDRLAPCVGQACVERGYAPYWDKEL